MWPLPTVLCSILFISRNVALTSKWTAFLTLRYLGHGCWKKRKKYSMMEPRISTTSLPSIRYIHSILMVRPQRYREYIVQASKGNLAVLFVKYHSTSVDFA